MPDKRFAFALTLAAAALMSAPAAAGDSLSVGISMDVHGHHRAHLPVRHVRPLRVTGPDIYYSYHYDHIPGYPVPIFPSHRPPLVIQPAGPYVVVATSAHVEWCHARYRSYRAYDNTFQPYHGPRRSCWSPYM